MRLNGTATAVAPAAAAAFVNADAPPLTNGAPVPFTIGVAAAATIGRPRISRGYSTKYRAIGSAPAPNRITRSLTLRNPAATDNAVTALRSRVRAAACAGR